MHWTLIVKWLVLISTASAVTGGRYKRNFSYIKDFLTSVLFEEHTKAPEIIIKPDHVYEFYKIPGYKDILIKTRPIKAAVKKSITDNLSQEVHIKPFECFLGTRNSKETLTALQNVHNLFSTKVYDEKESNALRETMLPMILDTVKSIDDDVSTSDPKDELTLEHSISKTNEKKYLENNEGTKSITLQNTTDALQEVEKTSILTMNLHRERNIAKENAEIVDIEEHSPNIDTVAGKQRIQDEVVQYVHKQRIQYSNGRKILEGGDQPKVNDNFTTERQDNKVDSTTISVKDFFYFQKEEDSVGITDISTKGRGDIPEGLNKQ